MSKQSAVRRHRKTPPLGDRDLVINDSEAAELYGDIDPGRESLPAPSHQRERPTREGARQAIENRQGTESGAPMDLDHEIGSESCRGRVCQDVEIAVVAGTLKKKQRRKEKKE